MDMLSVHVPKCAGTSFVRALEAAYGRKALFTDYADFPLDPAAPMNLDPEGCFARWQTSSWSQLRGYKVVHGHYHIHKYRSVPARLRITFLREPVDRLISHYFFWRNTPPSGHSLHAYILVNNLSLEDFARLPNVQRCYTGVFFRGVDLREFDFVGFHDQAERDVVRLSALAGVPLSLPVTNTNPETAYLSLRDELLSDSRRHGVLKDLLAADIAFYEAAQTTYRVA